MITGDGGPPDPVTLPFYEGMLIMVARGVSLLMGVTMVALLIFVAAKVLARRGRKQ